ncbi:heme-binding domain-containing protein [Mucilaginibacter sp. 22184]|uniref:heme-binding domain-containing protein n=1 Tax=Mucilaginibacter sp. 22184 TaxID=3453887 RepID=UPI003F84368F
MNTPNSNLFKRKPIVIGAILLIGFLSIQFIRPQITNPPVTAEIEAPTEVKSILTRACYDCHSNETNLRWYDQISPVYWRVAGHVNTGRKHLNFSNWKNLAPADQKAMLWEAVNQIAAGAMPIKDYELVHPSAAISKSDLEILKKYVSSFSPKQIPGDTAKINAADKQYAHWQKTTTTLAKLPKALNGITYIPDYKNWETISTTERFDNGTMRVIFGNPIAIKAIREHHINPWPNGTTFAKVAWDQVTDKDGNIHTGAFKQVEYMIKDDKKYASTAGWGWARFKTDKLVPYGKTALFTNECVSCHKPLSNTDFVFTSPIEH